jgi:hypothetical protein
MSFKAPTTSKKLNKFYNELVNRVNVWQSLDCTIPRPKNVQQETMPSMHLKSLIASDTKYRRKNRTKQIMPLAMDSFKTSITRDLKEIYSNSPQTIPIKDEDMATITEVIVGTHEETGETTEDK